MEGRGTDLAEEHVIEVDDLSSSLFCARGGGGKELPFWFLLWLLWTKQVIMQRSPMGTSSEMHERLKRAMDRERLMSFEDDRDSLDEEMMICISPESCGSPAEEGEEKRSFHLARQLSDREGDPRSVERAGELVERKFRQAKKRDVLESNRTVSRLSKREITSSMLDIMRSQSDLDPWRTLSSPELRTNIPIDEDERFDEDDDSCHGPKKSSQRRKVIDGIIGILRKKKLPNAA